MKLTKQILEAIQRGINLAIDDFDDILDIETLKVGLIENKFSTKELLELRKWFVDLGLPSGTWWGKYNIGVNPNELNNESDWYGNYYAWGEIETKLVYTWDTYKYSTHGSIIKMLKYCQINRQSLWKNDETPDNILILQPQDDVATLTFINEYPKAKMPTKEQIQELLEYTTQKLVSHYNKKLGLHGVIFISKINNNEFFIPYNGYIKNNDLNTCKKECDVWSSSIYNTVYGYCLCCSDFHKTNKLDYCSRDIGCGVRPVIQP